MLDHPKILVVDDDVDCRTLCLRALRDEAYQLFEAENGVQALEMARRIKPDLVLLDLMMPLMNGYEVCKNLKSDPATRLTPVVMLTGMDAAANRVKGHEVDVDDYLTKPFEVDEIKARVKSLLRMKRYTDELESASVVLQALAGVVEKRDAFTSEHGREVGMLAARVASAMGLGDESLWNLRMAGMFHDLGKVGVPDSVLRKPGALDLEETKLMRSHSLAGAEILAPMRTLAGAVPLVRHHHERLDGSGYPDGLDQSRISMEMRILSVVDVYQALVAQRPYKPAFPPSRAVAILLQEVEKGWWDGRVVSALADGVLAPGTPAGYSAADAGLRQ